MPDQVSKVDLRDIAPTQVAFQNDVVDGLRRDPKQLPCKYFYDEYGAQLFEQICEVDEYYLTRTEMAIMDQHAAEMADALGPGVMLVEFGSGSSRKTRLLLDHLQQPTAYMPVDISRDHLRQTANQLARSFPGMEVLPVCADFTEPFELPKSSREPRRTVVYFPGSTIGNFEPETAERLLHRMAEICGSAGGLLIGVDLDKDVRVLEAAYNDSRGVTAAFNLNLLARINRELNGNFALERFRHQAVYNSSDRRIEMCLVSDCRQTASIAGEMFEFSEGERICTEYSHKYSMDGFVEMAKRAGFDQIRSWTDANRWFGVLHFLLHDDPPPLSDR